ncbi:MAG: hypothetical protein IJQ32_02765 [Paludibacteraceae bacterium]|nr:hypothetical protein [Paludibacteraceae bacterium]
MKKLFTFFFAFVWALCAFAQLPYNTTMTQSYYNDSKTVITKEGTVNWNDGGIRLGTTSNWTPGNWSDKYVVIALNQTSIPYQLTFKYKCNSGIATTPNWSVSESSDNSNWSTIWSAVTPTSSSVSVSTDTYTATPIEFSKSTKYIKLCYTGNYSGTFIDIKVSDQAYVNNPKVGDNEISSLDFGTGTISSGKAELAFDVEWCNVPAFSVTSDNAAFFAVSPASFGGKAKYGTQTVTVTYDRDKEVGEHNATITMTNGSITKTVTVSGATTKRAQAIHWAADLTATSFTLNAEDALSGAQVATADNEEAEITFASDNTEVIAVSEDGKTLYAVDNGTANVTVTATGNDIYTEATDTKLFTVTSNKKQVITWEQNFMSLKTNANPNTIELTATATSGGTVTYALEEGSDNCVKLSGENNATMTITGTPGVAYIIATQEGGEINEEIWIAASARKQIKVRNPNSDCDEYALADQSFNFSQGHKSSAAIQEYNLVGKPTQLTFTAKAGGKQYIWSEREAIYVDQYANFGSGLEWRQLTSMVMDESSKNYGPYTLNETATKIRFRTNDYSEHNVSNISVPRKKELVVSETSIVENVERNVKWSKVISVSRSNIDVVDIAVESSDPNCKFEVSKSSIGTDCADRTTETFEVSITPREKDSVYTGTITLTDGKATPTTHTITLQLTAVGFNQSINNFDLPENAYTMDTVLLAATATSELPVVYLSSDSTVAYVENNQLVILKAGTVDITAYQEGDDRYNATSMTKTIVLHLTPTEVLEAPVATEILEGTALSESQLRGGKATVEGSFAWENLETIPTDGNSYPVIFTPSNDSVYASTKVNVPVVVSQWPATYGEAEVFFCSGDSVEYDSVWYYAPIVKEVVFSEKNIYGSDSIVTLTVTELLPTASSEEKTIVYGTDTAWNGIALNDSTVGEHIVTYVTTNVAGCDSTVTLTLTVEKQKTEEVSVPLSFCQGGFVEYRDTTYYEAGVDTILALGEIKDTLYCVSVEVLLPSDSTEYKTIVYGTDTAWNGIALNDSTVGEHIVTYVTTNAAGCDSTVTLTLTVEKQQTVESYYPISVCNGDSAEYRGKWYYEAGADTVLVEGAISDTLVYVTIAMLQADTMILDNDTLYVGDTLFIEANVWYFDGVLLTDTAYDMAEESAFDLIRIMKNEYGCDSTIVRHIVVVAKPEPDTPTAIEGVKAAEKAVKEFRNGIIYIRRGEHIYTTSGLLVK